MVNKVIILGNLGQDPEVKHLESGSVVARLNVATSESYKNKQGEKVKTTEWHNVELWEGLAKVAEQYLKKGDSVYLEGKIKTEVWTDSEGKERKTQKIRANSLTMIGGKSQQTETPKSKPSQDQTEEIDPLPF